MRMDPPLCESRRFRSVPISGLFLSFWSFAEINPSSESTHSEFDGGQRLILTARSRPLMGFWLDRKRHLFCTLAVFGSSQSVRCASGSAHLLIRS